MAYIEHSSREMASLASRAMLDPASLTLDEIRSLGGSVLTQAPDHNPPGAHKYYNALSPAQAYLAITRNALADGQSPLAKLLAEEYGPGSLAAAGLAATKRSV